MYLLLLNFLSVLKDTIKDVTPVVLLVLFYQLVILRKPLPNPKKIFFGIILVILGLTMFLIGLEYALFPIGNSMAEQLSSPKFVTGTLWYSYYWIYLFAFLVGFSTSIAEPSLIAVAIKANEVSGGTIPEKGLRLTVALGVAISLVIGAFRIISGTPLYYFILICYIIVLILTVFAPKQLVPLAYDVGGVTTSTVTVPVVAAIGIGLSSTIPDRNPALDGFGMIALACLFPVITVLGYAIFIELIIKFKKFRNEV